MWFWYWNFDIKLLCFTYTMYYECGHACIFVNRIEIKCYLHISWNGCAIHWSRSTTYNCKSRLIWCQVIRLIVIMVTVHHHQPQSPSQALTVTNLRLDDQDYILLSNVVCLWLVVVCIICRSITTLGCKTLV